MQKLVSDKEGGGNDSGEKMEFAGVIGTTEKSTFAFTAYTKQARDLNIKLLWTH